MEADWEVEIGAGAPVIETHWPGFIDLRIVANRDAHLPESAQLPGLEEALIRLNTNKSPVWTSKCDVWTLDEFDLDELDAPRESSRCAVACYIDLLPSSDQQWPSPEVGINACKAICERLRTLPLRSCRVDLILRRALIAPDEENIGITAYLMACGPTKEDAVTQLGVALAAFADVVTPHSLPKMQH